MQKNLLSFFLAFFIILCLSQGQEDNNPLSQRSSFEAAEKIYQQAEIQAVQSEKNESLTEIADKNYQKALQLFIPLLKATEKSGNDSLSFLISLRTGLIYHYFDSLELAKKAYISTLSFRNKIKAADSLFFKPAIFAASILYSENNFDSAQFYLKYAESIKDSYKEKLSESQRLYNLFGVINFQTGNYRQAENYFEKALDLLSGTHPDQKSLRANYLINIGLTLVKLEEYEKARIIYRDLLQQNLFSNEVNHDLGFISLKEVNYPDAINYFRKVRYADNNKAIDLYLSLATAFGGVGQQDSSEYYLQLARNENNKWNGQRKNVSAGLILKYQGDQLAKRNQFIEAAKIYQQAIFQFDVEFTDTSIYKNPQTYSGVFSYINMFNTLSAKAIALEQLHKKEKNTAVLESSLDAYRSAFLLADYVERIYTSDEARLFLGKIKYAVHNKPVEISLRLFELTKKRSYLEEAYLFDQRNKASVLSYNIRENELKNQFTKGNELVTRQSSLKNTITRLSLKATQTSDSLQQSKLSAAIRDSEIELAAIEEKLKTDPQWEQRTSKNQIPRVNELQNKLDNATALLSFHLSDKELLSIVITKNKLEYQRTAISDSFFSAIDAMKKSLQNVNAEEFYSGLTSSMSLYRSLIAPVESKLTKISRLIIIPDDELNYLPFEALQDEHQKYLLEKFTVQYQYSTALLQIDTKKIKTENTLAFAPFTKQGYTDSAISLSRLLASKEEITGINGKSFIDNDATKSSFLQLANHYNIIHLATHASVNNQIPFQSFIAFSPAEPDFKLYASEIYNLDLDSTHLVILSACETGAGKLVKGEGLMSLSRAFAYAGCPNIITSLWKANDKTTSFITRRVYYYLNKNYSIDKALQQAKLDLLHSDEIDPRLKNPSYWAHLVFIGNYEPSNQQQYWKWIVATVIICVLSFLFIKKKGLTLFSRQAS